MNEEIKKRIVEILYPQNPPPIFVEEHICNMDYYDFLNTPYWKAISEYVKVKNHYKCEICGEKGSLHVHHPTYDFHGRELQNMNKLKCLCDSCHKIFHNKKDNQKGIKDGRKI